MATLKELESGKVKSQNSGSRAGYLLEKVGEGLLGSLEGTGDFVAGGIAKLFGDEDAARLYFEIDDAGAGNADYKFNPGSGWKMAGDVAQGIGNSLPMMATAMVGGAAVGGAVAAAGLTGTAATAATTVGNGLVTFTSSFLSASGSGVSEAYKKTGVLDEKAWRSGIASGAIEGATETFIDPILGGATSSAVKLGSKIAGTTAKATAKRIGSTLGVQIAKDLAGSFISEAVEEGVSGVLSPIANNLIYRQEIANGEMSKENLDWHDIGYQMLVGGLSGAIMGGTNIAASNAISTVQGAQAIKSGKSDSILKGAQEILNAYSNDETMVNTEAYKYLQNTLANAKNAKGLMSARYIAEVQTAMAQVTLSNQVVSSARSILSNPELVAERINQFGLKDANGNAITVTAKQIEDAVKNGNLANALTEEDNILRKLAVLDAAGRLYADTQAYETAVEQGTYLGDRADVARFLQTATPEEVSAVNASLGIDIASASYDDIRKAFVDKAVNRRLQSESQANNTKPLSRKQKRKQARAAREAQNAQASAQTTQTVAQTEEQTNAQADEQSRAQNTENTVETQTRSESVSENTAQNAENSSQERVEASEQGANTSEEEKSAEAKKKRAQEIAEANRTLVGSISQWEKLNSRNRTLVRQTYMQAVANGYSQEDSITFARLSAKAGINIEFTAEGMKTKNGDTIDGYYDRAENVIVVNPKSKKPFESLLIHELTHSLEGSEKYFNLMQTALKSITAKEAERITKLYSGVIANESRAKKQQTLVSEYTAHFTEKTLKNKNFLAALVKEDATVKDKIVSFFKQRFGDEKLDRTARKLAKAYEKAFNEMAEANFGANASSASYSEANFDAKQYNLSTYREATVLAPDGERKSGREILSESLKKAGKSEKEISALLKQIDDVADVVAQLSEEFKTIKDFQGIVPYYRPKADGSGYEPMLRCVVKNGEYELNIDFTTICKKRENLSRFLTEFQESGRSFGKGFTQEAQAYLHNLFKKYDLETACTFCFVESRRVNVNAWSEKITGLWNKALKANGITDAKPISSIKDIGKIDTVNGITDEIAFDVANLIEPAALATMEARATEEYQRFYDNRRTDATKKVAPNTEERMLEYIKNHAKDGKIFSFEKSDFLNVRAIAYLSAVAPDFYSIMLTAYGANAPKMTLPATPYASDIFYDPSFGKKNIAEKAFGVGGVRINSFSDFQISRILDYVQFIADCEARGLPVQTYTKELAMVEILGKCNLKGNMSLIPEVDKSVDKDHAGLDKKGNYILSRDSVDFEKAIELQERDGIKGYWGTVLVGISKYQILTALDDPRIKMIIPYHRSGMPKALHHYYNHTLYTDYTKFQTTRRADGEKLAKDPFLDVFYKSYRENGGDYFKATEAYLQHCKENDLIPRFAMKWSNARSFEDNFNDPANYILNHPNYYKVLIDFTSDGGVDANGKQIFVPQTAVKLDLSGIDVESVVRRDAKLLEQEIGKYEENKGAMFDAFESALNGKKIDAKEQKAIRDARVAEENKTMVFAPQRQYSISPAEDSNDKITVSMSDAEREKILRKKYIVAPVYSANADTILNKEKDLTSKQKTLVKSAMDRIATVFGVYGEYDINDIDIVVSFSKSGIKESVNKAKNAAELAKLLPVLKKAVENSIGIEVHANRYFYDTETVLFENLLGGYLYGDYFVPVRFGLKFPKKGKPVLYVVVSQEKIKAEVIKNRATNKKSDSISRSAEFSIADIVPFVNGESKDILRYLPDGLLNDKQRTAKWEAIADTIRKTNEKNDRYYVDAINRGDLKRAYDMVKRAAKANGYEIEAWHGTRESFNEFSENIRGKATGTQIAKDWFFASDEETAKSYSPYHVMQYLQSRFPGNKNYNPEKLKNKGNLYHLFLKIQNPLEFDAANYDYKSHVEKRDAFMELSEQAKRNGNDGIILQNVIDNNLDTSKRESTDYLFKKPNQAKSADLITYDDNGSIIPLSERFNPSNNDIRYSISESDSQPSTGGGTQSSVLSSRTTVPQQSIDARLKKQANRFEIDFVNEFAGIESFLKGSGADAGTVESAIQSARSAYSRGQSQIGYGVLDSAEMRKKGGDLTIKQPGLQKIFSDVRDKGDEYTREFFDYLLHMHNVDRMSLEERSKQTLAVLEQIRDIMANDKSGTAKEKIAVLKSQIRFFDVARTLEGVQKQIDNFEIEENKPVFGDNRKEKALLDESIKTLNAEVVRLEMIDNKTRKDRRDLKNAQNRLQYLRDVQKNYVVRKEAVTAKDSEAIAKEYEKKHPEFRAKAEQVWEYNKQINRNRANDGLLSERDVEYYEDKYPHYVPTFRESYSTGISPLQGKNNIAIRKTVSAAEGGGGTIAPLDESMAKQTLAAVRAGSLNILANMIYDAATRGETDEVEIVSVQKVTRSEAYDANYEEETPKGNEITFYRDGERITMRVSREIFAGFDAINGTIDFQNPAMTMLQKVMDIFKKSVTTYNPLFVIRNKFRDVQDAGFNTKYGAKFAKMLFSGRAEREIKANSKLWQAFVAAGGMSNTAFDATEGFQRRVGDRGFLELRNNPAAKVIDMVNIANDFVEQTTRFTEFILSIEAGNSVEQAILDSQEVTTNFGRKGRIAKKFNATISPFLNPSIQGFDKIIRNVKDATKTKEAFLALMFKVALLGIVPQVLNEFIHGFDDDDEYDELTDYVKTNNFLFKVGKVFIRIPKGRLSSAIAGAVVQTSNAVEGRKVDIKGYVENTLSQMSPAENVTRTIFSPVTDVINNRSWSGGTIESQKFENVAPEYRYDERTSSIAIALGKVLKYSPKKIHYLLDQYTGVIGDIILPATSAAAQKDMFSANMTVDAVTSNRLSGDFYDLYDEVNFKKNDPKASESDRQVAADQAKFLNRVKSAVSDLQQQKTEIQNSNKSKKEKLEETRVIQALINEAYRQAFSEYKDFSTATSKYSDIESADERFAYELRDSVGAESALKHYNKDVYEKSKYLNTAGISYDNYFDFYFASKNLQSDKDKNGNTISGSLRKKVVNEIRKTKLTADQKLLLLASRGYKPQDGDFSGMTAEAAQKRLLAYVRKVTSGMSKDEKEQFAQAFGMKVKNNLIFL